MPRARIVVPCYNEAARFDAAGFHAVLADARVDLLFVDDGSRDGTDAVLRSFCDGAGARAATFSLARNSGKAEAVRTGMLRALDANPPPDVVGYLDADLSTSAEELTRLLDEMDARGAAVVMGARVAILGSAIDRRATRHYLGRIFSTAASLVLALPVYDTQCGAKVFRGGDALRAALVEPFLSRWAFDVELIGRLLAGARDTPPLPRASFVEVPLRRWTDVGGSKLRAGAMVRSAGDLARIAADLRRRRGRGHGRTG